MVVSGLLLGGALALVAATVPTGRSPIATQSSVWIPGYWYWHQGRFEWIQGTWVIPPFPDWVWIPPLWAPNAEGAWEIVEGRWATSGDDEVVAAAEPPAPLDEQPTDPPDDDAFWVAGHWTWLDESWVWFSGRWEAPRPGFTWEAPRWVALDGQWRFIPAGWRLAHDLRSAREASAAAGLG